MDTETRISIAAFTVLALLLVGVIAWAIVANYQMNQAKAAALDACWECGWGRVEYVQDEYRCLILEDGAEAVRTIEWVQENACDVLER